MKPSILCLPLFVLLIYTRAQSQTITEIGLQFSQKKYEQVLVNARQLLQKEPDNPFAFGVIGAVYVREAKYDSSVAFSQNAIKLDNDSSYISGWAHAELGTAYIYTGLREKGIEELKRTIVLGMTTNSVKIAKHLLDSIGYELPEKKYEKGYLPNWVIIEGRNITYKFQDTAGLKSAVYKFIATHEEAYDSLYAIFQPKLPRKIIIHVWEDAAIAEKVLHRVPDYSDNSGFAHVMRSQTAGFPLNYILAYWSWGSKNTGYDPFTDAGVCSAFDLQHNDKPANARWIISRDGLTSVLNMWEKPKKYDRDALYWVAGAFIDYLYKNTPPEQFRKVVKVQKLDDVKKIYGDDFNKIVADFDKLMGMKG